MAAPDLGVFLPSMSETGSGLGDMAATARHAEDLGFESAWVVDQLVAGTGVPFLDSGIALAVAAGATSRIRLGYGVMILPLRPVVWAAKQVASLQQVSGDRVILGVGVGGDRHDRSWAAAGVPVRERGRRTDAALRVLPDLIAGKPTRLDDRADGADGDNTDDGAASPLVELSPGVVVPPIVVGGGSDAAVRRVVEHGDSWFLTPGPPAAVARDAERLASVAAALGRPAPTLTGSIMPVLSGDPAGLDHAAVVARLTDPDGMYGMPAEYVDQVVFEGSPAGLAEQLRAYHEAGAVRVVATIAGGDWYRQVELLAEARELAA